MLERHRAGLYAAAVALLGSAERAKDAVQETSFVAMRRLPELRDPATFGPWLRVIGRHVCLMERRRGYRELPWVGVHDGSCIERLCFHHPARVVTVAAGEESR